MTERFYSPPKDYRVEFSAKSYDYHVYISFLFSNGFDLFSKKIVLFKNCLSAQSWYVAGVGCLLLIQGLFESEIWKTFERRNRI